MNPAEAAAALLQIVEDKRKAKCSALREGARNEARAILIQAHVDARKRVRVALEEARKRGGERIARAESRYRTRERLARQRRLKALLELGWARLSAMLVEIWRDPTERWQWLERCALRAATVLPAGQWEIAHPSDWPAQERDRLRQLLQARGVGVAAFIADASIRAGVRMRSGYSVFDATLGGFLADRATIEARLLFHLEAAA